MMRVVIDTSILVSFAIRPNPNFEKIFDYIARYGVTLVSEDTIAELFGVLSRDKFRNYLPVEQILDYVDWYCGISEQVLITEHIVACPDPKDDKFISLAVSGKADCIITGDHHLLDMVNVKNIPIYRPDEFVSLFLR